jgi:hypothetical protein
MNIFTYTDPSTTKWVAQGCYADGSARVLNGYNYFDGAMTVASCQATCASKGFKMAGVEL